MAVARIAAVLFVAARCCMCMSVQAPTAQLAHVHTIRSHVPERCSNGIQLSSGNQIQPALSPRRVSTVAKWRSRRFMNWAFTYANLTPYGFGSFEAWLFMATNLGFFVVGGQMATTGGDPVLGALCELAGSASVWYHYTQVRVGGNKQRAVQLTLALDYCCALPTIAYALAYAADLGGALPPTAVVLAAAAFGCLGYGCKYEVMYEQPRVFMVVHGCWHLLLQLAGAQMLAAHAAL